MGTSIANLLPFEIAEVTYEHLKKSIMEKNYDFASLKDLENNLDIMQFYLAAKKT